MNQIYVCANGHTFSTPVTAPKLSVFDQTTIYTCPECCTREFRRFSTSDELKAQESDTGILVVRPGRKINGAALVTFECPLCACEFKAPVSECTVCMRSNAKARVTYLGIDFSPSPVACHICPNHLCGTKCEALITDAELFTD